MQLQSTCWTQITQSQIKEEKTLLPANIFLVFTTQHKEPISISSPEAEEKHNLYAYTRKRCRNPYGPKTWSKKARTSQTEEIGSDEDAAEAPPTSFVTASHKLVILFDIILA
jgi:hypothetical protein